MPAINAVNQPWHPQLVNPTNCEYHRFRVLDECFECPGNYAPEEPIGKGGLSIVCSARNRDTSETVAIKKIPNAFVDELDAKLLLQEIKIVLHLSHENIIQIRDLLRPASQQNFRDVYIAYQLMDTDLHQIIRSSQHLSNDHHQYFIYQILRGLKYIHSADILHRNLKPSNMLVNSNCDLKICDFGLAHTSKEMPLSDYRGARWYRAPELMLPCYEHTAALDVWSVGCILAELLGRKPFFQSNFRYPGDHLPSQHLDLVIKVIGTPTADDVKFIANEELRQQYSSLPPQERADLRTMFPHASDEALDLLKKMLVFDPAKRITVDEALKHPYLLPLHDPSDEPNCPEPFEFDLGSACHTADAVRELVYQEILEFGWRLLGVEYGDSSEEEEERGDSSGEFSDA